MATFRRSQGIISEHWTSSPGPGNLPRWQCTGLCTASTAALTELKKNIVNRCQFTPIPNNFKLIAVPLDGTATITLCNINVKDGPIHTGNSAPDQWVRGTVKLGPLVFENYAPKQTSGDWNGYAIVRYTLAFQELG